MFVIEFFWLFFVAAGLCLIWTRVWRAEFQPVSWREFAAAVGGGLAFLWLVYNVGAFSDQAHAGTAVFLTLTIPVFVLGGSSRKNWKLQLGLGLMLVFSALRILHAGCDDGKSALFCALVLVFLLAAVCSETPLTLGTLSRFFFTSLWRAVPRGLQNIQFVLHIPKYNLFSRVGCAAILVPALLVFVFGLLFVSANPAILEWFKTFGLWLGQIFKYFYKFSYWFPKQNGMDQFLVFGFFFCGLCGFLAPRVWTQVEQKSQFSALEPRPEEKPVTFTYIVMHWNSLFVLILLFAVELTYEFSSLLTWNQPEGFDFGTYCHEGAFWLTMALGLATLVLAVIFRPNVCRHEKVNALKYLAFIWLVENALLAVTIYIRLGMYVQQTGLTPLRVVGFFGTTAVAVGLIWMVLKLKEDRSTSWLMAGYTWTVTALVWFYTVLPVESFVWQYNVEAIQTGNKAPLVHIATLNPVISEEGLIPLFALLQSRDPIIRNGVAAVIMGHRPTKQPKDWRNFTYTDHRFRKLFNKPENQKVLVQDAANPEAIRKMKAYGQQYYK